MELCSAILLTYFAIAAPVTLQPWTLNEWQTYVLATEKRIEQELAGRSNFLRMDFMAASQNAEVRNALRSGTIYVERMKTLDSNGREIPLQDGMIHHWYGAIFVPRIRLDGLLEWVQDYDHHSMYFKDVEQSKLLDRTGDTFRIYLRLTRTNIVTVHYNIEHTTIYQRNGERRASSRSFTTKIAEIDNPGTAFEREKPVGVDNGYIWRLNSYWRFREQEGGVVIECETIGLSRSVPFGLGWLVGKYAESIPKESLENTLMSIRHGISGSR
ncbi:MAG: hypothetical protein DMG15_24340 [Acidobacteria bacterium]|nr:MAG: hypothetical protein DMG15_24340 [Acidobacteriota bacterium]